MQVATTTISFSAKPTKLEKKEYIKLMLKEDFPLCSSVCCGLIKLLLSLSAIWVQIDSKKQNFFFNYFYIGYWTGGYAAFITSITLIFIIFKNYKIYCVLMMVHMLGLLLYSTTIIFSYLSIPEFCTCWTSYCLIVIGFIGKFTSIYYYILIRYRWRRLWKNKNSSATEMTVHIEPYSSGNTISTIEQSSSQSSSAYSQYYHDLPPSYNHIHTANNINTITNENFEKNLEIKLN